MNTQETKKSNALFVADLPKDTTFDDLANLFKDYHFQFANLNNSKLSKIWAQVYLEDENWANKARHELNGEILKPKLSNNVKGKPIRICKYEGRGSSKEKKINQSLLVKNIDSNITQKQFYKIFLEYGDVESAKIEYDENGNSKGYGYIYYSNEKEAEEAKKNLNGKEFNGKPLNIVNLVPSNSLQGKNLTLFVINFPLYFTDIDLRKLFEKYGNVKYASVSKDLSGNSKGFGFITFSNFEETSRCISDIKNNQIVFAGLQPLCVKYATKKEDRERRANFTNNNYSNDEYKIRFNLLYSVDEINNEFDLEKEMRLFIKVIMLQEYSPKEVQVDFNTNSGIITLSKLKEYETFMQKYNEFCMQRQPEFECIPISFEENIPKQTPNQNLNYMNNPNRQIDQYNNYPNQDLNPPLNQNYMNTSQSNYIQINKDQKINNIFPNMILVNGKENFSINPNQNKYNQNANYNQNPNILFSQNNQNNNNRRRYNNNFNGYNNNNNNNKYKQMNPNNINMNKFSSNQNFPQRKFMNPQQMNMLMMMQNRPVIGNFPANISQIPIQPPLPFMYNLQRQNILMKNQNEKIDEIDQRNLQNLNPSQLHSQFKDPTISVFNGEMIDSKESEEISNEIADSIYEIAYNVHPVEAAKITGMIKEMGIEKMNMLISKKEDLLELIEKGYEMIKNEENNH